MGTAIGIVALIGIAAFLVWVVRQPDQETAMGIESKARREAKKAANRKAVEGQSEG
ncbi:MAG: hypothetical protein QOH26_1790 [Actinomycetota bacterium]|nr:hypothetical protein [Actinomycetota bacterium]